jgi:U3 small nucleolar RNA-associated protein 20
MLPKMVSSGILPSKYGKSGFALPQSWQDQIVSKFERLEVSPFPEQASPAVYDRSPTTWHDRCLPKYNALLEVLESTVVHPSTNARIAEILLRKLKLALRPSSSLAPEEANFIVGRGFNSFSRMSKAAGEVDQALEPLLRAAALRYARLPNFLEALLDYEMSLKSSPKPNQISPSEDLELDHDGDLLVTSLVSNLSTGSHDLRLLSLRLLDHIYSSDHRSSSEALSIMIMVEQTPLDLQTARSASMHIRKLAAMYPNQASDSWLKQAIPSFCFGMLTVKFAQVWEDASASLKQIAESKAGEEAVAKLAFEWLETPSMVWDGSSRNVEQSNNNGLTDFECSNLMKLDQLAKEAESEVNNARDTMLQKFADAQSLIPAHPPSARAQALRVLSITPSIAEKRSRQLVPMFLSWAGKQAHDADHVEDSDQSALSDWTRKDQKAQLDLFCLFTNSKSLFKSEEVYRSLLELLANGDIEIQKSALKAIFTWKNPGIKPYEENLLNLLDEARLKEEIGILLQGQTLVQTEHRPSLMPVLLRILYGRSISRKGAASGKQGMEARRLTILRNLGSGDIEMFLDIALGELKDVQIVKNGKLQDDSFEKEILSLRKQVGFTHMIEGLLEEFGTKIGPFTHKLVDAVLYCSIYASRQLQDDLEEPEEMNSPSSQTSLLKVVRKTALKCLVLLFANVPDFNWLPYINAINKEIISPRLESLPIETAQGISIILRLFWTWSSSSKLVLFLGCNDRILPQVAECLAPQKSKDEVKRFALNVIDNIVKLSHEDSPIDGEVKEELLTPNMDYFLIQIGGVLKGQQDLGKTLLEACVETVSQLAPFVTTSSQAWNLVNISVFLLDQPARRVTPKTKSNLLLVLEHFVPLYDLQNDIELKDKVYNTITSLFGYFQDKESRKVLSRVLMVYAEKDPVIGDVAKICTDLNSYIEGRLDEPDYDRRLKAFNVINSVWNNDPGTADNASFTARQWTPLLFNMLYYIRDKEEFSVLSSNSSDGICRFIDAAGADGNAETEKLAFKDMISTILTQAVFSGARDPSEYIRREYLKVMAHLVRTFPTWSEVSDMHGLLAGDDEVESSFFNNILTTNKGQQSSALRQLAAAAERGELSATNVAHFFIPTIEHFVLDPGSGNDAHSLAAEAATTVGILAGSLEWSQYGALLRRFIGHISKPGLERQMIRQLGKIIDALAQAAQETPNVDNGVFNNETRAEAAQEIPGVENSVSNNETPKQTTLSRTMPKQQKLSDYLISKILPPMTAYLHDKDESTVSLRVPVAIIIVKVLKLLPQEQLDERLPAVLTDICHILRSKAQESRDMTRDTLTKICVLLGPSCFGFVLKELRGALKRGPQLHVLSYTMHSLLVATIPQYAPGDLDYCLSQIVAIIMDDIFGETGQEKDAEEYVSKMKEVKSSMSHDSMELVARTATLSMLTVLVKPIQDFLKLKLNIRIVRKIDELLNRISRGLLKNSAADSRDSLVFCYEIVQDVYKNANPEVEAKPNHKYKRFLIQKGANKSGERGSTTVYTYKLLRFTFDVLRTVLKKYEGLRTPSNLAGWIPIIGDAVAEGEEEVKVAAFQLLTTIIKVPLKVEGTDLYRIAVAEALKSISSNSSTISDISQSALKLISAVLRDRKDVPVKDTAIDKLLTRLKDDMTEPERRHVTFKFLRAVLDSKVETAVVYDTLDYVGTVMITNPDKDTRDLARGAYFQFLVEYPQQKKRWKKQLSFITANFKYKQEGGRLSVLEIVHLLLNKLSDEFVQEVAATCFLDLCLLWGNDESEKCRMAAGEVFKQIFRKADFERTGVFIGLMRGWIKRDVKTNEDSDVVKLAMQLYGFYYDSQADESDVPMILEYIITTLNKPASDHETEWVYVYTALELTYTLLTKFPTALLTASPSTKSVWAAVRASVSYPHAHVKTFATRTLGALMSDFAKNNISLQLPLRGSGGLKFTTDDCTELIRTMTYIFKAPVFLEFLAEEVVKDLVFLGRVAGANNIAFPKVGHSMGHVEEDEDEQSEGEEISALDYLFNRLSSILRKEVPSPPRAPALLPKTSALQLLQILTSHLPTMSLTGSTLETILLPLHNLTDPSIPSPYSTDPIFTSTYEGLKSTAEDVMNALKKKVGTKEFSEGLVGVRKGVRDRRMKRSAKRRIEAVSEPEKSGKEKKRKGERKKERRKERGAEHSRRRNEL